MLLSTSHRDTTKEKQLLSFKLYLLITLTFSNNIFLPFKISAKINRHSMSPAVKGVKIWNNKWSLCSKGSQKGCNCSVLWTELHANFLSPGNSQAGFCTVSPRSEITYMDVVNGMGAFCLFSLFSLLTFQVLLLASWSTADVPSFYLWLSGLLLRPQWINYKA